jgi:pyruvate carboxylase
MLLRVLDVLEAQVVVVNTMELRVVQEQQTKDLQVVLLLEALRMEVLVEAVLAPQVKQLMLMAAIVEVMEVLA